MTIEDLMLWQVIIGFTIIFFIFLSTEDILNMKTLSKPIKVLIVSLSLMGVFVFLLFPFVGSFTILLGLIPTLVASFKSHIFKRRTKYCVYFLPLIFLCGIFFI